MVFDLEFFDGKYVGVGLVLELKMGRNSKRGYFLQKKFRVRSLVWGERGVEWYCILFFI